MAAIILPLTPVCGPPATLLLAAFWSDAAAAADDAEDTADDAAPPDWALVAPAGGCPEGAARPRGCAVTAAGGPACRGW